MDESKTNENLAAAMGMDVSEIEASDVMPAQDALEELSGSTGSQEGAQDQEHALEDIEDDEESSEETTSEDQEESEDSRVSDAIPYDQRMAIKAALAGDGLPESLIEGLSPDQLQAYWAKRQQRDEAFDGMKSDLRRLKADRTSNDEPEEGGAPTKEPDNPLSEADLSALAEEFGHEEAQTIAGYVKATLEAQVQAATAPLLEAIGQMVDAQQRSRLSGAVPDGLSEGWYEQVRDRAIELGQAGTFSEKSGQARQDALFDAALRLEFPDLPSPAEMQREEARSRQRRNGTPSRAGKNNRQPEKLSAEDATHARAMAAVEGMSLEEIRKRYG